MKQNIKWQTKTLSHCLSCLCRYCPDVLYSSCGLSYPLGLFHFRLKDSLSYFLREGSALPVSGIAKMHYSTISFHLRMILVWLLYIFCVCCCSLFRIKKCICLFYDKITLGWNIKWKITLLYSCFHNCEVLARDWRVEMCQ